MKAPVRIRPIENDPQSGGDLTLQSALGALWRGKGTIFAWFGAALIVSVIAQILIPPRYTGEAIIGFNFESQENAGAGAKQQAVATLDAAALVDGAARIVHSRAVARAAVDRLGLDRDPRFNRRSTLERIFSAARSALRLQPAVAPSPRELATERLLSQVAVTNEPRSYLITVRATAADPRRAADLANAVALEYLRSETVERLKETLGAAERNLNALRSIYGKLHPSYLSGQERVAQLQANLAAVRNDADLAASLDFQVGPSFVPADVVAIPSSPNPREVIGLGGLVGLALGAWLSLRRIRSSPEAKPEALRAIATKTRPSLDAVRRWALALPTHWSTLTGAGGRREPGATGGKAPSPQAAAESNPLR